MILLIQFRTDQSGWHEVKSIYEAGGVPHHHYSVINAVNEAISPSDILDLAKQSRLVLLGGVGEGGYEAEKNPAKANFEQAHEKMSVVIPKLVEHGIPVLGMCFGHQILADTLGGSVAKDDTQAETGIAKICLTEDGRSDPLLEVMEPCFSAVVGHKVSVTELPKQAVHLAQSNQSPLQSFRYNSNVYGFQFHPELDKQALEDRLRMYPEYKDNQIENSGKPITADKITKRAIKLFANR